MTFAAAPAWAMSFRSDDLDEVRAFIAPYDGDHRRHTVRRGALGFVAPAASCGDVDLGWTRVGQRQRIAALPRAALLHLPLSGRVIYQFGARTLEAHPGTAVLLPPGREYRSYSDPYDAIAIRVSGDAVAADLAQRCGNAAAPGMWDAAVVPMSGKVARALIDLHEALVQESGFPTGAAGDAGTGGRHRRVMLESALVGWFADQLTGTRAGGAAATIGLRRLRRVEDWIDANLTGPITLARLCEAAGVGARWLEASFKARHGQSPMRYVTSRRLVLARRLLADARTGETVAQIAANAGFAHLGRFAGLYREVYGESPSRTLAGWQ